MSIYSPQNNINDSIFIDYLDNKIIKLPNIKYLLIDKSSLKIIGAKIFSINTINLTLDPGKYDINLDILAESKKLFAVINGTNTEINGNNFELSEKSKVSFRIKCIAIKTKNFVVINNFSILKDSKVYTKIVISKGSGGLGDLINVMVRAKYYSDQIGANFFVDWRNGLYDNNKINNYKDNYDNHLLKNPYFDFFDSFGNFNTNTNENEMEQNDNIKYDDIKRDELSTIFTNLLEYELENDKLGNMKLLHNEIEKLEKDSDLSFYPELWNKNIIHLTELIILNMYRKNGKTEDEVKQIKNEYHDKIYNKCDIKLYKNSVIVFNGPNINNLPSNIERKYYRSIKFKQELTSKADNFLNESLPNFNLNANDQINDQINDQNICENIDSYSNKQINKDTYDFIAVHYRHGNGEFKGQITSYDKFFVEIDKMLDKYGNDMPIFLSTDSSEVESIFQVKYNIFSYPKLFPPPLSGPLHKNREINDKLAEGKNAIIDMYLLSKAKYLIHNYSSFNWYAQYNGNFSEIIRIK